MHTLLSHTIEVWHQVSTTGFSMHALLPHRDKHTMIIQYNDTKILCITGYFTGTGTCFIPKRYALSSSLLQSKLLAFSPSPLRLNIFPLFVILSLTQLYRYTPEIFLFSTATFKYTYRAKNIEAKWGRGKGQMFTLK